MYASVERNISYKKVIENYIFTKKESEALLVLFTFITHKEIVMYWYSNISKFSLFNSTG